MSDMHPAGYVTVDGTKHNVSVGEDGNWYAWPQGNQLMENSKMDLVSALRKYHRKKVAKVAVPFTQLIPNLAAVRHGVATGIHSRSGKILVRWSDGETEQLNAYNRSNMRQLTADEEELWTEAQRRYLIAWEVARTFEKEHQIDLADTVQQALDAAVAAEET